MSSSATPEESGSNGTGRYGDVPEVDHQGSQRLAAQRRQLVHQTRWGTDVVVLRGLGDPCQFDPVDVEAGGGRERAERPRIPAPPTMPVPSPSRRRW